MSNVEREPICHMFHCLKPMTMGKSVWDNRCKICGQYALEGDEVYIIYPEWHNEHLEKLGLTWGIVHQSEFDSLSDYHGTDEIETLKILAKIKMPRFKGFSEEQLAAAEQFKQVCHEMGFYKEPTISKHLMKIGKSGSSFRLTYDMITGFINREYRARTGLFDGLLMMQLVSTASHKLEVLQGKKNPSKIVTVSDVFSKALDDADKLMNRR